MSGWRSPGDRPQGWRPDSLSGQVSLKEKTMMLQVELQGKTKDSPRNNLKLDVDYYLARKSFRGNVEIRDAALNDWGAYLLSPVDYSINSGNFSAAASLSGSGLRPGDLSVYGYFGLSNGDIIIKGNVPVKDINATLEVNNDSINIKRAGFSLYGGSGRIKGSVKKVFTDMAFDASLKVGDVDLSAALPGAASGTAQAVVTAKGSLKKYEAQAVISCAAGYLRGMAIQGMSIKAGLTGGIVKLNAVEGKIGSGAFSGSGEYSLDPKIKKAGLSFKVDGIDAGELAGAKDFSGKVDLGLKVSGSTEKPEIAVSVKSPVFKYGLNNVENFTGAVALAGERITGSASMAYRKYRALSLALKATLKDGILKLDNAGLSNSGSELVTASGKISGKDGSVDLAVIFANIMLSDLSIGYLQGKEVDGIVKGGVFIRGTTAVPVVDVNLNMDGLSIRGATYRLYAGVHYGGNLIKINEINFNDSLKGAGEFSLKKKIFDVNFDVKDLKGDVISEITGTKIFDGSLIGGKILVKKESAGYGGNVTLEAQYAKGANKSAKLEMSGQGNVFNINRFEVKQKEGLLKLGGGFSVVNEEKIETSITGKLENFSVNDKLTAGGNVSYIMALNLAADGSFSDSQVKFTDLVFNGKPQDDLEANLRTEGFNIPEFKFKWGTEYYAEASVDAKGDVPEISAGIRLKDADLYGVYMLLGLRDQPLGKDALLKGEFAVKGPLNSAAVSGAITQPQGSISANGVVRIERKKGFYNLADMSFKYNAVNLDINNFFSIFEKNFKDKGRINGSGEIRGTTDKLASSGSVTLAAGKVFDMPFDTITADYAFKDKKISLTTGKLEYKNSFLKLDGSEFEIKGDNNYYATIKTQMKDFVWQGFPLNGDVNFFGSIDTEKDVHIDGSIGSQNFGFRKHTFGGFLIKIDFNKDRLLLKTSQGKSKLSADIRLGRDKIEFAECTVDDANDNRLIDGAGFIDLRKDGDSALNVSVKNAEAQFANDMLNWDHKWTGTGNALVKLTGNPTKGINFVISATLINGSGDGVPFDIATLLITKKNNYVDLSPVDPMTVIKEGKYTIKVTGKVPVPDTPEDAERMKGEELDIKAKIKEGDLSIIKFLKFVDDASGKLDVDLAIKGTKEFPSVTGKVSVTDGEVKLKYLFKELKNIYANLLVKDNIIDIYNLRGDTERGTIKIANLNEKKGGTMRLMKIYEVNWRITNIGDRARFTDTPYMEFLSGDADLNLEMTGLLDSPDIKGTIDFENTRFVYPANVFDKSGEKSSIKDNYALKINWDAQITGGDNVRYYKNYFNNFADMTLKFDNGPVKVLGRGTDMKIFGTVGVAKGTYKYMNTEFNLDTTRQSKVNFDGDRRALLDVWAKTTMKKIDMSGTYGDAGGLKGTMSMNKNIDLSIIARFYGRVGDVKLDLMSEPSYNRDILLYVLTFGVGPTNTMKLEDAYKYINIFANSWFKGGAETIKNWTPLDVLDIKVKNMEKLAGGSGNKTEPGRITDTPELELGLGKSFGDVYFEYRPKLIDVTNQFGQFSVEQKVGAEWTLNNASKLVAEGIFRDQNLYKDSAVEGKVGIEIGTSFDSWGAKPTPAAVTPTAVIK